MKVLSIEHLKWIGLAVSAAAFFQSFGSATAEVTIDLPVRKIDPLTRGCVAYEVKGELLHCHDTNAPSRYRDEVTFPHATFEQLLALHKK
jgi:hypothetical protein